MVLEVWLALFSGGSPKPRLSANDGYVMRQSLVALRNSAAGLGGQLIYIVLALFLSPFIIHRVGDDAYGVYLLALSIVNFLELLRNPVARTCTVEVAKGIEIGQQDSINRTISAAVLLATVPAVLGFAILAGGSEVLYRFFDVKAELHLEVLVVLILAGVAQLCSFPLFPFQGVVWGRQRHDVAYAIIAGHQVLRRAYRGGVSAL